MVSVTDVTQPTHSDVEQTNNHCMHVYLQLVIVVSRRTYVKNHSLSVYGVPISQHYMLH